jgi:SAM-dependent methyltransferase
MDMMVLANWKVEQASLWGSGTWQDFGEHVLAPVHDKLVRRLDPRPAERWADLACGTGAVARRAARLGAVVVALDLAPALVETGGRLAASEGLAVSFDVGDVEQLPYPDARFDVVSSAHGVVFAADHRAMARELARGCRPGGRLGLTFWRSHPELEDLKDRAGSPRPKDIDRPRNWGRSDYARELLGDAFELEFSDEICAWRARSGEDAWRQYVASTGHATLSVAALSESAREDLHAEWVEFFESYRTGDDGSVCRARTCSSSAAAGDRVCCAAVGQVPAMRVAILGAGFGGLELATRLSEDFGDELMSCCSIRAMGSCSRSRSWTSCSGGRCRRRSGTPVATTSSGGCRSSSRRCASSIPSPSALKQTPEPSMQRSWLSPSAPTCTRAPRPGWSREVTILHTPHILPFCAAVGERASDVRGLRSDIR